jgi:hypothetical protein
MSIEFESENLGTQQFNQVGSGSAMVDFLIRNGIVKDPASANVILVVGALICIAISIYLFVFGF